MFQPDILSIIRSRGTVFTASSICHTIYDDCLLADSHHKEVASIIRIYHDTRSSEFQIQFLDGLTFYRQVIQEADIRYMANISYIFINACYSLDHILD